MAASLLSKPGSKLGPCAGECRHLDCFETRRTADSKCPICEEPIGYDRLYYLTDVREDGRVYSHADCFEMAAETLARAK